MEWVLILVFYICMDVVCLFFFLALFVKLLNRGELQMVGNISVSLLVHDRRGGRGGGELETMEVLKCCRLMRRMLYHPGFILSLTLIVLMWRIG